jgi:hypothetical protein
MTKKGQLEKIMSGLLSEARLTGNPDLKRFKKNPLMI